MPQPSRSYDRGMGGAGNGVNSKKKFGKNLNKLVKPAAPPISSDKSDRNVRNGLLLLSSKKPTSGLLSNKANAPSAGIVHKPQLNLQSQSNASTHQVLLSAVVGALQADKQQKLDAWGVAEKIKEQQHLQHSISADVDEEKERLRQQEHPLYENGIDHEDDSDQNIYEENNGGQPYEIDASWDDYGGRGESSNTQSSLVEVDEQGAYMAKLARERAQAKLREEEARYAEQKARAQERLRDLEEKSNSTKKGEATASWDQARNSANRSLWDPNDKKARDNSSDNKSQSEETSPDNVIHLASYEDRDRGERNAGATPRMLYDPKSGAMVEVKAKVENNPAKRKDRKTKSKKDRDSGAKDKGSVPTEILKNGKKSKPKVEGGPASKAESKKVKSNRTLPRTCGVLYYRTEDGQTLCADECDGDLGYGAHSVPGGRIRNPEAYVEWFDQNTQNFDGDYEDVYEGTDLAGSVDEGIVDETPVEEQEYQQPPIDWVSADDKIELLTGIDDSPTLKPTAKEWAPSEAALAAAAAAANVRESSDDTPSLVETHNARDNEESEPDDETEEPHVGLGFDPLQDIDFMGSHTPSAPNDLVSVDLQALSLEPQIFASNPDDSSLSRPIFAFGASGTWGASKTDSGLSGWDAPSSTRAVGLFGSEMFGSDDNEPKTPGFLGSPASSWGTPKVAGFEGLTTSGDIANRPAD